MQFSWTGKSWFIPGIEERCKCLDMGGGETRPGWQWDVTIGALVEVRRDVDGGDIHISTCLGMRWNQNGGWPHMIRAGWRGYATWMEMRCEYRHLDGGEMQHGGGMLIHGHCQRSDSTWMALRQKSCNLQLIQDWDTGMEMKSTYNILGRFEMVLDIAEMQISGTGCSWDVTWIEVRHRYEDLHQGETRPGWRWDVNLRGLEGNEMGYKGRGALHPQTWIWVIWNLLSYNISGLDGGDTACMEVRHEYRHQAVCEM